MPDPYCPTCDELATIDGPGNIYWHADLPCAMCSKPIPERSPHLILDRSRVVCGPCSRTPAAGVGDRIIATQATARLILHNRPETP